MATLLWPFINLAILVGVLVYFARTPLVSFVGNRHLFYRDEVKRVEEQLSNARERFDEFSSKLKAIDAEISAMKVQVKADADAMKQRIFAEAQKLSTNIISDSRASAQGLIDDLKLQLRNEFSGKVIDRAEKLLRDRLTGDDRARIRREFSASMSRESA